MDKLSNLWQGAGYQDNLLQAYRNFHLTIQSILIAIGAGITIATLTFENKTESLLCYGILAGVSWLGIYLLIKMRKLIIARGEDVDYFHKQIIDLEKTVPKAERVMTAFKVYQKFNRQKTNVDEYFLNFELSDNVISELTEKGKGHTRKILDRNLFVGFFLVWILFHAISICKIIMVWH